MNGKRMMLLTRNLPLTQWNGLKIGVDSMVVACGLLLLLTLRFRLLPYFYTSFTETSYWGVAITITLGSLGSLIAREWFHLRRYRKQGGGEVCFKLFGTKFKATATNLSEYLSGQGVSLALSFLFLGLMLLSETNGLPPYFAAIHFHLACANLTLAAIHLLPALPLDGGKALMILLTRKGKLSPAKVFFLSSLGYIIGTLLVTIGSYQVARGTSVVGLWILFIGFLLMVENHREGERIT